MLNQVNLNTNNAFTSEMQKTTQTNLNEPNSNLLSITDGNYDTVEIQKEDPKSLFKKKANQTPLWLKAVYSTLFTAAAVLGVGFMATKLGYIPLKSDTSGLYNNRNTEFKNKAKDAIGGIGSVMTLNSHCGKKSLEKIPETPQNLLVMLDEQKTKGIELLETKFKDNIVYGGVLKLSYLKDYKLIEGYVRDIAKNIKKKESHENIIFASESARCANMLNAVLRAHAEGKEASTSDFVDGGIPTHYFWGSNGIDSKKLDEAIWKGWREGLEIKESVNPQGDGEGEGGGSVTEQQGNKLDEKPAKENSEKSKKSFDELFLSDSLFSNGKNFSEIKCKDDFINSLTDDAKNALYDKLKNITQEGVSLSISKDKDFMDKESITIKPIKQGNDTLTFIVKLSKRFRCGYAPNISITLNDLKPNKK